MHLKGADGTAGVADGHNPLWNVVDHHAAPADDGAAADGDAGIDNGPAAFSVDFLFRAILYLPLNMFFQRLLTLIIA